MIFSLMLFEKICEITSIGNKDENLFIALYSSTSKPLVMSRPWSSISKNVKENSLALTRAEQKNLRKKR